MQNPSNHVIDVERLTQICLWQIALMPREEFREVYWEATPLIIYFSRTMNSYSLYQSVISTIKEYLTESYVIILIPNDKKYSNYTLVGNWLTTIHFTMVFYDVYVITHKHPFPGNKPIDLSIHNSFLLHVRWSLCNCN